MKVSLNIVERIIVLGILPIESNIVNLKVIKKLKEDVGFSEEEVLKYDLKIENDQIKWNAAFTNEVKEIEIGIVGLELISNILKDLNTKNKLTEQHLSLFDKIIGE
jgi:bacterioferritin (cytochrome b1)